MVVAPLTQWAKAQQWEFPDLAVRLGKWPDLHGLRGDQQDSLAFTRDAGKGVDKNKTCAYSPPADSPTAARNLLFAGLTSLTPWS